MTNMQDRGLLPCHFSMSTDGYPELLSSKFSFFLSSATLGSRRILLRRFPTSIREDGGVFSGACGMHLSLAADTSSALAWPNRRHPNWPCTLCHVADALSNPIEVKGPIEVAYNRRASLKAPGFLPQRSGVSQPMSLHCNCSHLP
jgi:hypothetical protein